MSIPFTQYLRPHGRKTHVEIDMPWEIEQKAKAIMMANLSFECEELLTGKVSLTISNQEQDLFIEVVPNNEEVVDAVARLVEKGYEYITKTIVDEYFRDPDAN
jgi:hypothetical protein